METVTLLSHLATIATTLILFVGLIPQAYQRWRDKK